jgi:hypothetical protein
MLLSKRDFLGRISTAKRTHYVRIRENKRQHQSMLMDPWPELRPSSLPVYPRKTAPPPPLPRSMPNLGWIRDPPYRIRLDPPKGVPFPFPHPTPDSQPYLHPCPIPPDPDNHMSTSPKTGLDGITPTFDLADLPTSRRADRDTLPGHTPDSPSTAEGLKFLTINAQKAGANSSSLVEIITMMDQHSPDFLFLV